jgi:serine/threonine-protein kinase
MTPADANPPDADDPAGRLIAGRFVIRRLVASGGMAKVYEAEDLRSRRVGALKLLRAHCRKAPDAVERLVREGEAATRISGPHVARAIAAGRFANGEPYLFMELLEGLSLRELLERRGRLGVQEALQIVERAARGLTAAHAAGILHRDIKPANLFLAGGEQQAQVKLLDFGVSKFPGQRALTREGLALGTFSYMPPEQMMSAKRVDARADLFSLGVVLYESLAGRLPFSAKSVRELMQRMETNDYLPLSHVRPDAPPEVDAIIARTVRADPSERFASARELRDALTALCERALPQRMLSVGAAPRPQPAINPAFAVTQPAPGALPRTAHATPSAPDPAFRATQVSPGMAPRAPQPAPSVAPSPQLAPARQTDIRRTTQPSHGAAPSTLPLPTAPIAPVPATQRPLSVAAPPRQRTHLVETVIPETRKQR